MEDKHGVDVSWLHHSKDAHIAKEPGTPTNTKHDSKENGRVDGRENPIVQIPNATPTAETGVSTTVAKQNGDVNSHSIPQNDRLQPNHKPNEEITNTPPATPPPTGKDNKSKPSETKRRGSWISNISSKFSSSASPQAPSASPAAATVAMTDGKEGTVTASSASSSPLSKDLKKVDSSSPAANSPKSSGPSFLQSALRRLSSSGGSGGGKMQSTSGICPRKVMNVDPYRERCQIHDLQPAKLRRVSFCVDVEIAAAVQYDDTEESPPPPATPGRRPSLGQLEKFAEAKKAKDKNVKVKEKAEGEALKHPDIVAETKDKTGDVAATEAKIEPTPNPATGVETNCDETGCETKKKKKRTEAEKAERRERKRLAALANGSIPMEIAMNGSSSDELSTPGTPQLKSQDRPTTDPLRIYRRCCQLRESPVLKRIADQLSAPNACDPTQTSVVSCIDLTGFKIPLADTITLSDWLAIVPVRKVVLEDCDLTDEAIRVILAGLLAVKTPDQAKFNRRLSKANGENTPKIEQLGVVEKVSLKDNPRITREGWRHLSCFLNMSRSLKALDLSGIPLPPNVETPAKQQHHLLSKSPVDPRTLFNVAELFERSLAERIAKDRLEELVMAKCKLSTAIVEGIIRGVTACGIKRLGLAYNNLNPDGVQAVCNFLLSGRCEGLDLGGNDLSEHVERLAAALDDSDHPLYALSVADCNLTPQSLKVLLPVLARLPNFKFIDLSHNKQLYASQPNATPILRKYLPQLQSLRRIHLNDVSMGSEQCIALAEVLPEVPNLAHIGIMENPKLTALASAKDEILVEEACAYFASIMVAVRVSRSIVSIEMDMPSQDTTELVQALGKQILAYALRNLERGPAAEAIGAIGGRHDSIIEVPDILLHLVGHVDDFPENHDDDEPAPSEDYIVSGTGVVKALSICLGSKAIDRRSSHTLSRDRTTPTIDSGTSTPQQLAQEVETFKAKDMSKNLLDSARKIRMRLQPALAREQKGDDETTFRRLQFLDSTLLRMIERFEEEYPECRQVPSNTATESPPDSSQMFSNPFAKDSTGALVDPAAAAAAVEDEEEEPRKHRRLSRHGSDASLAARHQAHEEAQMHRFGQQMRRSLLAPSSFDYHHQTTHEAEAEHLRLLRSKLEALSGAEIADKVVRFGVDNVIAEIGNAAADLRKLEEEDPEGFAKLRESYRNAERSVTASKGMASHANNEHAMLPEDSVAVED